MRAENERVEVAGFSPFKDICTASLFADGERACADAVILGGSVGLENGWTGGQPRFLLPLPGATLIDDVLVKACAALDGTITVVSNTHTDRLAVRISTISASRNGVSLHDDTIPRGTAGCIKACESRLRGGPIFVIGASIWLEDDLQWMLAQHQQSGNVLSVFCIPHPALGSDGKETRFRPAEVYCCEPSVLDYICATGFEDLKEQLIPKLLAAGHRVGAIPLVKQTQPVSDWATYLHAVTRSLSGGRFQGEGYRPLAPAMWCGEGVEVADDARMVGPVWIGHGCRLARGSVVVGPAMLGDACHLERDACCVRSIVASGRTIPTGTTVRDCMVPALGSAEPSRAEVREMGVGLRSGASVSSSFSARVLSGMSGDALRRVILPVAGLAATFIWAFSSNFASLWRVWQNDANYSSGQLVPLAVLYMVVTRRDRLRDLPVRFSSLGLLLLAVGLAMNLLGYRYLFQSVSDVGMVICASGLVMSVVGWKGYKRLWYPLAFLILMIPLPSRVHDAVMLPLQGFSAQVAATMLEMIGIPVERFGHLLEVHGQRIAVAEACNGLRMAIAFLIVTGVVAYLIERPVWQKVVVVLSCVPIALGCNVVRIVGTASLYSSGRAWLAQGLFHDGAGMLMMPLALLMVLLELWFLSNLSDLPVADAPYAKRIEPLPVVLRRR